MSARAEARGLTGRRLLWHRDRRLILAELDAFLDADEEFRATGIARDARDRARVRHARRRRAVAVEVQLGDGRVVRVRGKADRVDRRADGDARRHRLQDRVVRPQLQRRSVTTTRSRAGTLLQLPVYAYAARAAYGAPDTPVEAYYWFVGRGNNRRIGYDVDDAVDEVFADDGAHDRRRHRRRACSRRSRPSPRRRRSSSCHYCDPDGMGTTDRWREWERKCDAPELDGFRSLSERRRATEADA